MISNVFIVITRRTLGAIFSIFSWSTYWANGTIFSRSAIVAGFADRSLWSNRAGLSAWCSRKSVFSWCSVVAWFAWFTFGSSNARATSVAVFAGRSDWSLRPSISLRAGATSCSRSSVFTGISSCALLMD